LLQSALHLGTLCGEQSRIYFGEPYYIVVTSYIKP
jgi:hypothetical protein